MNGHTAQQRAPAILTFITADTMAFAVLFTLFMTGRTASPALYDSSSLQLNPTLGLLNTLILVSSSWLVVLGLHAARRGDREQLRRFLLLAMVVGAGFAVTKTYEYHGKLEHDITPLTNEFFTYYFILTGIHFLHFLIGMGVLALMYNKARTEPLESPLLGWITAGGIYWHMVDLLWIILFPMLYLIGRVI